MSTDCLRRIAALLLLSTASLLGLIGCDGLFTDLDEETWPGLPPSNLTATEGTYPDFVRVQWDAVGGVEEYRLYRDDELVYSGADDRFDDFEAAGAEILPPSTGGAVEASTDRIDGVQVSWNVIGGIEVADEHHYQVSALFGTNEIFADEGATGFRQTPEVVGHEVRRSDGDWQFLDIEVFDYFDADAPRAHVVPGTVEATKGEYPDHVEVAWLGDATVPAGPETTYEVRTVAEFDTGDRLHSEPWVGSGHRSAMLNEEVAATIDVSWQRSAPAEPADFVSIEPDATVDGLSPIVWQDTWGESLPEDNIPRYYRVHIEVEHARGSFSEPDLGFASTCRRDAPADFGGGMGTEDVPYLICDSDHLLTLHLEPDASFEQRADLDLSSETGAPTTLVPAGTEAEPFTGTYDGSPGEDSQTIENLVVEMDGDYVGLFGHTQGATLTGIHLENARVTGGQNTGGLVGLARQTFVVDSSVSGLVEGSDDVGGLIGSTVETTISDTDAVGEVTGFERVGGLVGSAVDTDVDRSGTDVFVRALPRADGESSDAGGLAGFVDGTSSISESTSRGHVLAGHDNSGAFIGHLSGLAEIYDSYATGSVYSDADFVGGFVGILDGTEIHLARAYATGGVYGYANGGESADTSILPFAGHLTAATDVETTALFYNDESRCKVGGATTTEHPDCDADDPLATGLSTSEMMDEQFWEDTFSVVAPDTWRVRHFGPPGLHWQAPHICDGLDFDDTDDFGAGSGSDGDPWIVCTRQQLGNINAFGSNRYYRLGTDLHLGSEPFSVSGDFHHDFDGAAYRIANLTVVGSSASPNVGLFSSLMAHSRVYDLEITDASITGSNSSNFGILAGSLRHAHAENIRVTGTVRRSSGTFGGLVGEMQGGTARNIAVHGWIVASAGSIGGVVGRTRRTVYDNQSYGSTIDGCRFSGTVGHSSAASVGGAVGTLGDGQAPATLSRCSVGGWPTTIVADNNVGGVVGYATDASLSRAITDSRVSIFALGEVSGGDETFGRNSGGVVGLLLSGHISDSYSVAAVEGRSRAGGIVGSAGQYCSDCSIGASYYGGPEVHATGSPASAGGVAGYYDPDGSATLSVLDSFYNESAPSADELVLLGDGVSLLELSDQSTFTTGLDEPWDFDATWFMPPAGPPRQQWEHDFRWYPINPQGVFTED